MSDTPYQNREIDEKFQDAFGYLKRIEAQTTKTNGRVTKLERYMLVVACVVGTLLVTNNSEVLGFVMSIL